MSEAIIRPVSEQKNRQAAYIRAAAEQDIPQIHSIFSWYVQHTAAAFDYEPPALEDFADRMRKIMDSYPFLVSEQDGRVTGYACAHAFVGREAYAWSAELTIYLTPDVRGQGTGRRLYGALEAELKRRGYLNLYACIGYPETEDEYLTKDSFHFHEHMGFHLAGTFQNCGYKFGRWYHMVWMEKLIGPHIPQEHEPV